MADPHRRKFALHGPAILLAISIPEIDAEVCRTLGPFATDQWPDGFATSIGCVRTYDQTEVLRHLSSSASFIGRADELMELYNDAERFWMIDDRWGMAQINMLKGSWRSWLLPQPRLDAVRCAEMTVLWPLAQILRGRGVHLVPGVSVVRDGWAALILSCFGLEPELQALIRAGYRVIGQRWTALREEDGRIAMMYVPGRMERSCSPRLRNGLTLEADWIDLCEEHPGVRQNHAFCDAVIVTQPGRRPSAHLRRADSSTALGILRRAWPIVELHPQRRHAQLPAKLAQHCVTYEVQASRDPRDFVALVDSVVRSASMDTEDDLTLTPWAALKGASRGLAA